MKKLIMILLVSLAVVSCKKDDDNGNANCGEPNGLMIDQTGSTNVVISWGTGGETAFQIEYGPSGFALGSGTVIQTSQTTFIINELEPGTSYDIYLRSNCGSDGFSDYISTTVVTLTGNPLCNAPSDLTLANATSNTIEFGWLENGETAWQIEYGISGFTLGTGTVVETSQNSYVIMGLSPMTTYEIYVRANCGSDGFSEYSDALVVTTAP